MCYSFHVIPWWRHQMETFSALLAICAGNSPVAGEFPTQRPVTRSSDVFFHLRLNKRLSKQSWGWWFETLSRSLWRHCNAELRHEHIERSNSLVIMHETGEMLTVLMMIMDTCRILFYHIKWTLYISDTSMGGVRLMAIILSLCAEFITLSVTETCEFLRHIKYWSFLHDRSWISS